MANSFSGSYYVPGSGTWRVDSSGNVYDPSGNKFGSIDSRGNITSTSGGFVGNLAKTTGGSDSYTFTTRTGEKSVLTKTDSTAPTPSPSPPPPPSSPPPPSPAPAPPPAPETRTAYVPSTGIYNFGGAIYTITSDGRIYDSSGNLFGTSQSVLGNIHSIHDLSGKFLGSLTINSDGSVTFKDTKNEVVVGSRTSPALSLPQPPEEPPRRPPREDVYEPRKLTPIAPEGEINYVVDYTRGLLEEATKEFFGSRDLINSILQYLSESFGASSQITRDLEKLGREELTRLQWLSKAAEGDIERFASQEEMLKDILRGIASEISRATSSIARGTERQENLARLTSDALVKALRGDITLPEFLRQDLERAKLELEDRMRRNLGTSFETSTPGIEALVNYERLRQGVLDEFRRGELDRIGGLYGLVESLIGNATDSILRSAAARAELETQAAGIPLQVAAARSGLMGDIGNFLAMGFNLADALLGNRLKTATIPLIGAQAKQDLAAKAVDVLGRAALLPAQSRATYMGLLFSALQPASGVALNPAQLLGSLGGSVSSNQAVQSNLARVASDLYGTTLSQSLLPATGVAQGMSTLGAALRGIFGGR